MDNQLHNINISSRLDEVVGDSLGHIRKKQRKVRVKKALIGCTSAAALFAAAFIFCAANPVMAGKLPLIGHIFNQVETKTSYKGEFSKNAKQLISEEEAEQLESGNETNHDYVQTSNGITMSVSEVYYNNKALYLAMRIENEDEFPADFNRIENMEDYILEYDLLGLTAKANTGFSDGIGFAPHNIEGRFEDMNTFVGIIRVDIAHQQYWPQEEEVRNAGIDPDYPFEEGLSGEEAVKRSEEINLQIQEAFPRSGEIIEIPDSFTYELSISAIYGDLLQTEMVTSTDEDGDETMWQDPIMKTYEGSWNFRFDVQLDTSKNQIAEINKTNEEGVGIAKVEKTPYEITAEEIYPKGKMAADYFMVICDASGDLLEHQGGFADTYSVYGRDTGTISVYMCDYIEYMDELKGYYYSADYETKKQDKTFAQYLEEHALFSTEVQF